MKKIEYNIKKEILEDVIKKSRYWAEVFRNLGINNKFGNYQSLKNYVKDLNIDYSHFNKITRLEAINLRLKEIKFTFEELFTNNSRFCNNILKKYIYQNNLFIIECNFCKQGEIWRGKQMSLILDHIDGKKNNNEITNLRLLCPNCNSTLDTHCGKNRKNKTIKYEKQFLINNIRQEKKEKFIEMILNSKIDFTKYGWGVKLSEELNRTPQFSIKFIKTNMPEFYKKCFKHRN